MLIFPIPFSPEDINEIVFLAGWDMIVFFEDL
jgi:hypothetical protein